MVVGFNDYTTPRGLTVCWSGDGGAHWTRGTLPAVGGFRLGDPEPVAGPAHRFYLAATAYQFDAAHQPTRAAPVLFVSTDEGRQWRLLSTPGAPPLAGPEYAQDAPDVAIDPAGTVAMAWTAFHPGQAEIVVAVSHNGGASFRRVAVIRTGYARAVSMVARGVGHFVLGFDEAMHNWIGVARLDGTQLTLGRIADFHRLPSTLPGLDFRVDTLPRLAEGPGGDIYATWDTWVQGRAYVALARSTDGGAHWQAPLRIPAAGTLHMFMPAIAGAPAGTIGVLAYGVVPSGDGRGFHAYLTLVSACGTGRITTVPIDDAIAPLYTHQPSYLGDYPGLAIYGNLAVAVWTGTYQVAERIYVRRIDIRSVRC